MSDAPARGSYANVRITDAEMESLAAEFPDLDARIERLSEYIAMKGADYANHAAVIRSWAKTDYAGRYKNTPSPTPKNKSGIGKKERSKQEEEDAYWEDFFQAALERTERYASGLGADGQNQTGGSSPPDQNAVIRDLRSSFAGSA